MNDIVFKNLKKETILLYKKFFISNNLLVDEIYDNLVNTDSSYSFSFFSILFSRNKIYFKQKTVTAKKNKRLTITIDGYGSISRKKLREHLLLNVIFFNNNYIKDVKEFENYFKLKIEYLDFPLADYFISYDKFYSYFFKYKILEEF